jgi:hypothetical protein
MPNYILHIPNGSIITKLYSAVMTDQSLNTTTKGDENTIFDIFIKKYVDSFLINGVYYRSTLQDELTIFVDVSVKNNKD